MASTDQSAHAAATSPQTIPRSIQPQTDLPASSTPLEMYSLPSTNMMQEAQSSAERQVGESLNTGTAQSKADEPSKTEETAYGFNALSLSSPSSPATAAPPTRLSRFQSTQIGPSSDEPIPVVKDVEETGPTLMITLLLINGARHPFKLDAKYLGKRNVEVQGNDPFHLSVYKLKELILREWREEWEAKPSSPTSVRLISFGKLLDDKAPLKDFKFNHDTPNVVHMTVKPQDMLDEEEAAAKGSKSGSRIGDGDGRSPGCRCVIL